MKAAVVNKRGIAGGPLVLTIVAALCLLVSAWVWLTGGGRYSIFGVEVSATDPLRPLALGIILFALGLAAGRRRDFRPEVRLRRAFTPRVLALALAVVTVVTGIAGGSMTAGGADSYGYISEADLWLKGSLVIPQPAAARVPWPEGQWTFAPLGYRPAVTGDAIVPMYSPGFPLLLAVFKSVAGHCAVGWAVPVAAGLLIAVTFAIGRKAVSPQVGAGAAWLLATSPAFIYMSMSPMSDVPAALFWALAIAGCLTGSRSAAALGGMAAAVAVLIRPNLAHVGLVMVLWLGIRDFRLEPRQRFTRAALFTMPLAVGCLAVAALNQHLYGSPANSGYGRVTGLFGMESFARNVMTYGTWMIESQTPLAVFGLLALWLPSRWTKGRVQIEGKGLLAAVSISVIGVYLFYLTFDAWWYLRFLLPAWSALCVGSASLLIGGERDRFRRLGMAVLVCVGVYGVWYAHRAGAFDIRRNEQRYVTVAHLVRDMTPPNSVIITLQHSGSVRYYGGRTTLRYEVLHDRWLDRSVEWLQKNGFHPYILLDAIEHEGFTKKYGRRNAAGNLDLAIVFEYRDRYYTSTFLYDALQPSKLSSVPVVVAAPRRQSARNCVPPAPVNAVFAMENASR